MYTEEPNKEGIDRASKDFLKRAEESTKKNYIEIKATKINAKENPISYEIKTFEDMVKCCNSDNIDQFLKDFEISLRSCILLKSLSMDGKLNFEFTWIDD